MERESPRINNIGKSVSREIANNENPGFISIDCGSKTDLLDDSGIRYTTDEGFVETGQNHQTSPDSDFLDDYRQSHIGKQLTTLRCFPDGVRNCYTLKPKEGKDNRYLIRAFFSYGNYDGKSETQSFELHVGVNLWKKINYTTDTDYQVTEIIYTSSTDTINVCLVKTDSTIPCISTLELRHLSSPIYQNQIISTNDNAPLPLLYMNLRFDIGPSCGNITFSRYKDDIYDRIWRCDSDDKDWHPSSLEESINMDLETNNDAYKLPAQALRGAAQPLINISYMTFTYDDEFETPLDKIYDYYVYFHFMEIEKLSDGKKRKINITLNSQNVLSQPLILDYLKPVTLNFTTQGGVLFNISATSDSDAPPLLTAFEIYKLVNQLDSPTEAQDVAAIMDIKRYYEINKLSWQGDPCVPKLYAWEDLVCNTIPRITSLNLSSSKLRGEINISFSYLTELELLDLSHNELEGHLPEFLAHMPKLRVLNLTGNKLSGPIPNALKQMAEGSLQLSVDGNPGICMTGSCKKKNISVPLVASLSALIVTILIFLGFWIFKRRKAVLSYSKMKSKHQAFSYTELVNITDNFKTIIGEGGFGKVYLGTLQDQTQVAVKMLSPSSMQGYREFQSEAQLLTVVHHRNLVSLIGYCDEGEVKALIYEYMANGNLQEHLSEEKQDILSWNGRLKIAVDAAHGLEYLHNGCKPPIMHRDLKPANILLDENLQAKIADFGLSRAFGNDNDSHISTRPAGTFGYVDPEFQRTGNANKKNDIYSFGIILFVLITGKKAVVKVSEEHIHILQWVIPIIKGGDIQNIVDSRLQGEFSINSAWNIVEIAMSCISQNAVERPDISQILVELNECLSLDMVRSNSESTRDIIEMTYLSVESDTTPLAR
ncbi:hypothetical protein P8452_73703 [Trifolium repens]|nr:hypothetical protein P8452_73703 [Trifolium repens]